MTRGFLDDPRRRPQADLFGRPTVETVQKVDLVDVTAELVRTNHQALLIHANGVTVWVPKSVTDQAGDVFTMPRWLASKKGLI